MYEEKKQQQVASTFATKPLAIQGIVYTRNFHEQEDVWRPSSDDERYKLISQALEYCEQTQQHRDIPLWVLKAVKMRQEGQKPILFLNRFSQNTLNYASIFSAVCVSLDIRHKHVEEERVDYRHSLDIWLKNRVQKLSVPIFLKLQYGVDDWEQIVTTHNGKSVLLEYDSPKFSILFNDDLKIDLDLKTLGLKNNIK